MSKNGKNNKQAQMCRNKKLFLEKYPEYGSIGTTLKAIGIKSRRTFYNWCDHDPSFKEKYLNELLPNRRDECVALMYRYATGQLGTEKRIYTNKKGETWSEEVPVTLPASQITALFGFLKATDHIDDKNSPDRLIFIERHQLTGANGGAIEVEHDAKGKLARLLDGIAASRGEGESTGESEPEGS